MKTAILILAMMVTACAVESGADGSLAVESSSEQALVERVANALGGAETSLTDDDACRRLQGCLPGPGISCCKITQTSRCCGEMYPGPDRDEFICVCSPLPHTDPGHGIPQEPVAPTEGS